MTTVILILLLLWLMGWRVLHIGSLIHLLLVVLLVVLILDLVQRGRVNP